MHKTFSLRLFATGVVTAFCLSGPAFGAVDMFLKIEDIPGESSKLEGAIDLLGFSYGVKAPRDVATGQSSGKRQHCPSIGPLTVSSSLSKASPVLALACCTGRHIPRATLSVHRTADPEPYLTITLEEVMVSSYSTSGAPSDDVPVDSISLNFTKIEFEYKVKGAGGTETFKMGYDLALCKK